MKKWVFTKKGKIILAFGMVLTLMTGCGTHPNNATVTNRTSQITEKTTEETETASVETESSSDSADSGLYIIRNLDMVSETIDLYSIEDGTDTCYKYNLTTEFLDKFSNSSSWLNFTTGSVVSIGEVWPSSGALSSVQLSGDVWTYEDVTDFAIDEDRGVFTIKGSNYKITSAIQIYSDDIEIPVSDITNNDSLTVIGIDKTILSVRVTTGHGYVHITNTDLFNNSLIFIGDKIVSMLYGETTIEVPEGDYKITVANDGWGGSSVYTVNRNETTEVNLDEIKGDGPKYSQVTFLVTVPDTYVYLDGSLIDTNEIATVRYGSHSLVVTCNGYVSWNKTLVVNSESATITLALEEDTDTASTSTSTDTSTDTSTSTATTDTTGTSTTSSDDDYDYETDYLSTVSDLLSSILGN